jgi:guanylate kinase
MPKQETGISARRGKLFVLTAPSGAGKTTLTRALLAEDRDLRFSVSFTTRAPRAGEQDGRDYFFVDRARFEAMIAADELLEYAKVFDNYYGTGRAQVEEHLRAGRSVLLDIDWQGARQVRSHMAESVLVFIMPPSLVTLEQRLARPGDRQRRRHPASPVRGRHGHGPLERVRLRRHQRRSAESTRRAALDHGRAEHGQQVLQPGSSRAHRHDPRGRSRHRLIDRGLRPSHSTVSLCAPCF